MTTAFKDYYATLGVSRAASQKEIRSAFRKRAREFHPDINKDPAAIERFKEINEANEVLSDPEKRKTYDDVGPQWEQYQQWDRAGRPGGGNPFAGGADPFAHPRSHRPGSPGEPTHYSTVSPEELEDLFGSSEPFSDFFNDLFGGGGGGAPSRTRHPSHPRPVRGGDVEGEVTITIEEAYGGTERTVELTGAGRSRTIEVKIPAGVHDGARVRVAGQGGPGRAGGASGDLFIRVGVAPHPHLTRQGADLRIRVDVPLHIALLGGEVQVPTPKRTSVALRIPAETQNGTKLRLRGQGMPAIRGAGHGDLIAEVVVRLPLPLDDRSRTAAEQFRP